jgi:hypothetical protein
MKAAHVFVLVLLLGLAACQAAPRVAQQAPKVIDDIPKFADDIDEVVRLFKVAASHTDDASQFADEANAALQNGQWDDWLKATRNAKEYAGKAQASVDEASALAAKIPEEELTQAAVQRLRDAQMRATIIDIDLQMTEYTLANKIITKPESRLATKVSEQPIVRALACMHLTTMLFEGRAPTQSDYEEFINDQGLGLVTRAADLDDYAVDFIDLANSYADGDSYTQMVYEQKVSQFCDDFLKPAP